MGIRLLSIGGVRRSVLLASVCGIKIIGRYAAVRAYYGSVVYLMTAIFAKHC